MRVGALCCRGADHEGTQIRVRSLMQPYAAAEEVLPECVPGLVSRCSKP